ncbi:serine/threonine protein kinase [Yoonia maricola]|uniref:serine/threonine protein kinase n=1 Tax=Yoonia maricola TaxID=420999 RepID=UPI001455822C|nr:serine/threonine-protein kinase [Yoonia maricola]
MEPTRILGIESPDEAIVGALPARTVLSDGAFTITEPLGQGGFGITYLARDMTLQRDVVIKECFPEAICIRSGADVVVRSATNTPHFRKCVEMFVREARSIARLNHPNILHVHGIFEENGTAYMVLDLIEGPDLLDIIEDPERTLGPSQVHALTINILEALRVVHGQNLLHRDISPDNILVDKAGQPTLIDFGSAREFAADRIRQKTTLLFVKDGYSPFEFYASGAAHSPASDFYALGGTIYHLITGEAPPSSQTRQVEVQSGAPDPYRPLAGRYPDYDDTYLAAIDTALRLQPAQRIQTAEEWLAIIAQVQDSPAPPVPTTPRRLPEKYGNLVSETNKHVLEDEPATAKAVVAQSTAPIAPHPKLAWRDEFNQETEEILTLADVHQDSDLDDVEASPDIDEDVGQRGLLAKVRGLFAKEPQVEEDEDVEALMVQAYLQQQAKRRRQRSGGIGFAAASYIAISVFGILAAALISINYTRVQEDDSWTALFSLQGFCRGETAFAWTPVQFDCAPSADTRRLDLGDRQRILQMDDAN